jgi:hypothetical protein
VNLVLWAHWAALRLKAATAASVCQTEAGSIPSRIPANIPIHLQAEAVSFHLTAVDQTEVPVERWDATDVLEEFQAAEE